MSAAVKRRSDGRAQDEANAHLEMRERHRRYYEAARARRDDQAEAPPCDDCATTGPPRIACSAVEVQEGDPMLWGFPPACVPTLTDDRVLCPACIARRGGGMGPRTFAASTESP